MITETTNMKLVAQQLYNDAQQNGLVGNPNFLWPTRYWSIKSFEVITEYMLTRDQRGQLIERPLFAFMARIDIKQNTDPRFQKEMRGEFSGQGFDNGNGQQQGPGKPKKHWAAFVVTDKNKLYVARINWPWVFQSYDQQTLSITSIKDLEIDLDRKVAPYASKLDISTLRGAIFNIGQTHQNLAFIRNRVSETIQSIGSHVDGEDGREIYDEATGTAAEHDPSGEEM